MTKDNRMWTYIFDIDGTLADITHRLHFVKGKHIDAGEPPDWDMYLDACGNDTPIQPVIELNRRLRAMGQYVILITGRNGGWRDETRAWLKKHGVMYDELHMRDENDRRPDYVVKRELYEAWKGKNPDKQVLGVFDDRDRVVQMWRDLGLQCYQVAKGDY